MRKSYHLPDTVEKTGCLVVVVWLFGVFVSLLTSLGVLALVFAGLYYLCTGEFILQ